MSPLPLPLPSDGIDFKSPRLAEEWRSPLLPQLLRDLTLWLAARRLAGTGRRSVVTCIFRTFAENRALAAKSLTHVEWRAVDVRAVAAVLPFEERLRVEMTSRFPTGVKLPRVPPLDHGTGLHYHIQVTREETERKGLA